MVSRSLARVKHGDRNLVRVTVFASPGRKIIRGNCRKQRLHKLALLFCLFEGQCVKLRFIANNAYLAYKHLHIDNYSIGIPPFKGGAS